LPVSIVIDLDFLISHFFLFLTGRPVTCKILLPKMAEEDGLRQILMRKTAQDLSPDNLPAMTLTN
jgi:hypothetical protein